MTREEILAEMENIKQEMEQLKQKLLIGDGALQAFQYMLTKLPETAQPEAK